MSMKNADKNKALNSRITAALEARGPTRWDGKELWFQCFQNSDKDPSAHWNEETAEWKCFSCGAGGRATSLARRLGIWGGAPPAVESEILQPLVNLTLDAVAENKGLPEGFLRGLGIGETKHKGTTKIHIPYHSTNRDVIAVRYRENMGKGGFRWRRGDHPILYGLERLEDAKKAGEVLIFEGESDCWTSWYLGIPALGIPGKDTWKSDWRNYFGGLDVYLWQEPYAEDLTLRIVADLPDLWVFHAPEGVKDISEAHIQGKDVKVLIEQLKSEAVQPRAIAEKEADRQQVALYLESAPVLKANDPLELVEKAIRGIGYGGDIKPALITYLAATSRLLAMRPGSMPVHLLLVGPSSAGKSYTLMMVVLPLLPKEAYDKIDASSPRALIYGEHKLKNRVLAFAEADSLPAGEDNPAASAVRNLLQDHYVSYEVTVTDEETKEHKTKFYEIEGPTTLITTATKPLGDQMNTRLFHLDVPYDREQIAEVLITQGNIEVDGIDGVDTKLVAFQAYLQTKAPWDVVVPFAPSLAKEIARSVESPRILRDFQRLLSLVKSVAVLRHAHRDIDDKGRLVAEVDDYAYVRDLVGGMYETSLTGVSEGVRATVEAVRELAVTQTEPITSTDVEKRLGITKTQAYRDVKRALANKWLVNNEQRKFHPFQLAIGTPLPERVGLPEPQALVASGFTVSPLTVTEGTLHTSSVDIACANNESGNTTVAVEDTPEPPDKQPTKASTSDDKRRQLLATAEAQGWPRLDISQGIAVRAGEEAWQKFAANATQEMLEMALRASGAME